MNKIISQLEFWLALFGLAAIPNWSWPVWGSAEESRMSVLGLTVGALALLELINAVARNFSVVPTEFNVASTRQPAGRGPLYTDKPAGKPSIRGSSPPPPPASGDSEQQRGAVGFGFFKNPLNWIISVPLLLVVADWLKTVITASSSVIPAPQDAGGIQFFYYQFFGFGVPWSAAVLPILLLILWHFLLRSFFVGDDKKPFLKFAFAWLAVFALIALTRGLLSSPHPLLGEERGPGNIGHWFILASALALILSLLRVPLSASSKFHRLGRFIYLPVIVLFVALGLFIRFEIRVGLAAASASRRDFASARRLNPYEPDYSLSWAEAEMDALARDDLTADVAASKQRVGEIVKELEGLMSLRGAERRSNPRINAMNSGIASVVRPRLSREAGPDSLAMTLRIARAWERLGQFAEGADERALAIYDTLLAASGENPDLSLIIKKALLLEKSGKMGEAIEFLRQWLSQDKIDSAARYHLGRLLYNSGKEKEAADMWLSIVKDEPDYSDVNYSLGAYFARQKNYGQARRYFNKVLELNPQNVDIKKKIDELGRKR